MPKVKLVTKAPDFTLKDLNGNSVSLTDFQGSRHVILVLNRGFI